MTSLRAAFTLALAISPRLALAEMSPRIFAEIKMQALGNHISLLNQLIREGEAARCRSEGVPA
jgi:hypothetical protein